VPDKVVFHSFCDKAESAGENTQQGCNCKANQARKREKTESDNFRVCIIH